MYSNSKTLLATLVAAASVSAHSWVECVQHDNTQIYDWMLGNSTLSPPVIIDPAMPWFADLCQGWPRGKANPGNWIDESSNYVWNIAAESWDGGAYHPPNTNACNPSQRAPNQLAGAPMAEVAPGGMFRLRFGGNGHARGVPMTSGDPGKVSVYWKGTPEAEITDISEFTDNNLLARAGFSDNSFAYPADPNIKSPTQGLVDKGNWMEVNVPGGTAAGRYMLVWVWSYNGANQWSTCFDINVSGSTAQSIDAASIDTSDDSDASVESKTSSTATSSKTAAAAPESDSEVPPVVKAPTPKVTPPAMATKVEYVTAMETVTRYIKHKRAHRHAL